MHVYMYCTKNGFITLLIWVHNDLIWVYLVLCGTEGTQTLYCSLYCAQCCMEKEEVMFTVLALNAVHA